MFLLRIKVPGVKAELEKLKKKSKEAEEQQRKTMGGFLSRGRISTAEDEQEESEREAGASSAASSSGTSSKTAPKSKPTLASKINSANSQSRKPKASEEEEYTHTTSTWSGTAPKIQELADGEE